ncbi:MAG: hypothetical protein HYW85_03415, partial [Deltaproteobacteria bacterium]|nr:hypothetical protein [Deltaproteobacteria bacterium]
MVFQKCFSVLLAVAILASPFHSAFSQESQDFDLPLIFGNSAPSKDFQGTRKLLRDFHQLKEEVLNLFKAGEQEKAIEAFYTLKNFTEKILEAPLLSWDHVGLEFYISQLEDAMIKDVKGFEPIPNEERIFLDPLLTGSDSPTLVEKEKIFLGFEEVRKEFDKIRMAFHWNVTSPSYLKLKEQGKKDFKRFVSFDRYYVVPNDTYDEIIPKLSDLQTLELEALALDQSEDGWKNVLKRVAIDLSLAEWETLDSLWISSLHPPAKRLSVLPLSCQGEYQTLHPLTIPHLLAEKEKVALRALFEAQFYTMLRTDTVFQIPILISEPFVRKLLELIPDWKQEQEWLMAQGPEKAQAQIQKMVHIMQGLENEFTTYAISWYFQSQNKIPFVWAGTQEEIEFEIFKQLVGTKKILLLTIVERTLWDSKAYVDSEIKSQIVALAEEMSRSLLEDEMLKTASHRIYEIYEESKTTLREVEKDLLGRAKPKVFIEDQLKKYLELTQKVIDQDQKIAELKAGGSLSSLPPLDDTSENFKIASLVFAPQLTDAISKKSFDEIEKVIFEKNSTYEAAFYRYQEWALSFTGEEKIKEDMKKIAFVFGLTRTPHLSEVFKESKQRVLFEEAVRGLFVVQEPLLETEIEYQGHSKPLYVHLSETVEKNKSHDVRIELVQRAIWNKKQLVEYEVDRFCKLDPKTPEGLEFLLANTSFRKMALSKFPGFDKMNENIMAELHQELSEGKFEKAVGYGFLTVIGLSFVSGPLSRLPWWLGGRLAKVLPHSLLKSGHVFG